MNISLQKKEKEEIIERIKEFFHEECSEEIGELAAGNFLDFITQEIGPYFYNQGVHDAKLMVELKIFSLEDDLLSLERPI
jgi:uncharacterized protein (DUF2164 family)